VLQLSPLQKARTHYVPQVLEILQEMEQLDFVESAPPEPLELFPNLSPFGSLMAKRGKALNFQPLQIGVVLSGGQAPGGHNVIGGLFDAMRILNVESRLVGFLGGLAGLLKNKAIEITEDVLQSYRNQGGFDLIGSGRTKVETVEQFQDALQTSQVLNLDGLVIIGGDDSNTNACFLAEYFLQKGSKTCVIGVPKTIDNDLQDGQVEISFGFDTACRIYSETIGNVARDALSAKKYYFFIKLMGRVSSHIALECALQTKPNLALIGEEIQARGKKLSQVVDEIVNLIIERAKVGKDWGVILIPEGVIEYIADLKSLIKKINKVLATGSPITSKLETLSQIQEKVSFIRSHLDKDALETFDLLPLLIQEELLLERDPHGNVQLSQIETERLLISICENQLREKAKKGEYKGKFAAVPLFCGYEGRSAMPSFFDTNYCYNLGRLATGLIARKKTGYITTISNLAKEVWRWRAGATPLAHMMHYEEREGKSKAVIKKAFVDLKGAAFHAFVQQREGWRLDDCYSQPGPIQFFGPEEFSDLRPITLTLLHGND